MFDQKNIDSFGSLTQQEQKILKTRNAQIDGSKYKKGKAHYKVFTQSKKNENAYRGYVQWLKGLDYMNKILLLSSMKYYRDIKTLLIGSDVEDGKNYSNEQIQFVIHKLDDIIEGRSNGQFEIPYVQKANKKEQQKKETLTAIKETGSNNTTELKTEQKAQKFVRPSRIIKSNEAVFEEGKQIQRTSQKQPNKVEKKQVVTKLPEEKSQQFEKIEASEYKYLKLIEVESKNKKSKPQGIKSDRTNNLAVSNTTNNENERSASVRSFGKQTKLITDLSSNQLYQKHITSVEKGEQKTSRKQDKKQVPVALKKISSYTYKTNYVKKSSSKRREEEGLCDKLLSCLKSMFIGRAEPPKVKSKSEQAETLVKQS